MRAYSTQRPIAPGTFPARPRPVEIVNFDRREYVPEIGRPAWGYLVYGPEQPASEQLEAYELIAEQEEQNMSVNYYNYAELRAAALNSGTPEAVNALGEWFDRFGDRFWNGEYYDADGGLRLFPVYELDEDGEVSDLIGYELK